MHPAYEELATSLLNEVNVAEVDVTANRALGSRFDVAGFPTLLFLKQGQVYKYKGRRDKDSLSAFVKGGYSDPIHEQSETPGDLGYFGEVTKVFTSSFKAATKDVTAGKYFTMNVLTCVMPVLFVLFAFLLAFIPVEEEPIRRRPAAAAATKTAEPAKEDKKKD